jgi:hypothetical protein
VLQKRKRQLKRATLEPNHDRGGKETSFKIKYLGKTVLHTWDTFDNQISDILTGVETEIKPPESQMKEMHRLRTWEFEHRTCHLLYSRSTHPRDKNPNLTNCLFPFNLLKEGHAP